MSRSPRGRGAASSRASHARAMQSVRVLAMASDGRRERDDHVVAEEPLEIRVAGPGQEPVAVMTTLRTPGHEAELAAGWLHAEGIAEPGDIDEIAFADPLEASQPEDTVTVRLHRPFVADVARRRHAVATASCGVCGRAAIDELALHCAPVPHDALAAPPVAGSVVLGLPERLRAEQEVFGATGGLHATGLFDRDGRLVTLREDVGRHNALDTAIGAHVLAGELPLHEMVAVLSGRIGFELVQKVVAAGIPILAAVGAPTDLAIRTAERFGVTLVGFLRGRTGNVYAHPHRLDLDR